MTGGPADPVSASIYPVLDVRSLNIRLLALEPGNWGDRLVGHLTIVSLSSDPLPEYETVSYAWGKSRTMAEMYLNGAQVGVPTSSAVALRRLRHTDRKRILWIDAICINQQDLIEKASQVAIMSTIYRSGRLNLIVLDEDDGDVAKQTIQAIGSLGDHLMRLQADATPEQLTSIQKHRPDERFGSPQTFAMLTVLQPLFLAVWFTRIWVLQEMVLAPKSQCHWGDQIVPFNQLLNILYFFSLVRGTVGHLEHHWSTEAYMGYTCAAWMSSFLPSKRQYRLPLCNEVFLVSRSFSSSVPHDKIYALVAIIQAELKMDTIPDALRPNYHKPLLDLYRDATRFVLQHSTAPFILKCISHRSVDDMTQETKTSWTWLWDRQLDHDHDPQLMGHALDSPKPTNETMNRFVIHDVGDPNILATMGFTVDVIDWTTPMRSPDATETAHRLQAFIRRCRSIAESEEEAKTVMSQVLTLGNGTLLLHDFGSREQTRSAYEEWIEHVFTKRIFPTVDGTSSANLFELHFRTATNKRSVFTTRRGFIGVGPEIMAQGDVLALFVGGNSTSILRPSADLYRYVGAAYTYRVTEDLCSESGLIPTLLKLR